MKAKYEEALTLGNGLKSKLLEIHPWKPPIIRQDGYYEFNWGEFFYYFGEFLTKENDLFDINIKVEE